MIRRCRGFHSLGFASPILFGAAVPLCGVLVLLVLGPQAYLPRFAPLKVVAPFREELFARAFAVVAITFLLVGMIAVVVVCREVIQRQVRPLSARWLRSTRLAALVAFLAAGTFSLLDQAFGFQSAWIATGYLPTNGDPNAFFHGLNAAGAIPTVYVVSAAAATLHPLRAAVLEQDVAALRCSINELRLLLYMVALILVIATLELTAVYRWIALHADASSRDHVVTVGRVLAGSLGAMYTLFLIAVFAPAMYTQRRATEALADCLCPETATPREQEVWAQQMGLRPAWRQSLGRTAATLGPVASGSLAALVPIAAKAMGF